MQFAAVEAIFTNFYIINQNQTGLPAAKTDLRIQERSQAAL